MRKILVTTLILCAITACSAEPDETAPDTQPATMPDAAHEPEAFEPLHAYSPAKAEAEAWLERIEQSAADTHALTADLRYDRNQLLLGDQQRRFGTLVYQAGPPPKFAIHFDRLMIDDHWTQPDLWYIYDGRWLLKRDHENMTAVRYQLVADDEAPADAMALGEGPFPVPLNLKKEKVLQRFEAVVEPPDEDDPDNSVHLRLTPRADRETELTQIDLWFNRDTLLPIRVSTLDESETQTEARLFNTQVNPDMGEQTFDTSPPTEPGWQIDENRIQSE